MNMRLLGGGARYIGAILCAQKGYSPRKKNTGSVDKGAYVASWRKAGLGQGRNNKWTLREESYARTGLKL